MTWYILRNGAKEGPYSNERLGQLIEAGQLKPDDLIWKPGLVEWTPAGDIPGLLAPPAAKAEVPLPLPRSINSETQETSQLRTMDQISPALGDPESTRLTNGPSGTTRRSLYIFRHWRGELSLPISYWVNGILVTAIFVAVIMNVPWDNFVAKSPRLYSTATIFLWLLLAFVAIWQLVGIWRSANNYIQQGKSRLWGNLAYVAVAFGLIKGVIDFMSIGIPQITEYSKIAAGEDPLGTYQLRVLRNASELEIAGEIVFGLTEDVRRTLDAHPTIRIVHLNSNGGRVSEARNLRDLIDSRELTTFTASTCFSACTLAYAAGHKRLIASSASLGFHQYSFPGVKAHEFQLEYEKDRKDWLGRGFSIAFVNKAFSIPNNELWKPSHRELFEAGVVTGYPESDDVAITGFRLKELENIEAEFAKNPLFSTLKTHEPATYDRLISDIRSSLQQGRSQAELREKILPLLQSSLMQRLPHGSDSALRSFTDLVAEQMKVLQSIDPTLCYDYAYGNGRADMTKYFTKELQEKELLIMSEVIRSASGKTRKPPNETQIEKQRASVLASLTQRYGDDVQVLIDPELGKANKEKTCELTIEFYRTILELPERDSGALLRFVFAK